MFIDYYLKFANQEEARSILYTPAEQKNYQEVPVPDLFEPVYIYLDTSGNEIPMNQMLTETEGWTFVREDVTQVTEYVEVAPTIIYVPKYLAVDEIGIVYKPTGNMLSNEYEMQFPEMAPVDGWHVNVRLTEDAPELEQYRLFPSNPVRRWA